MKKPAEFTNAELVSIEHLINHELATIERYYTRQDLLNEHPTEAVGKMRNNLLSARAKMWAQLHGTCAADVEGV